MLMDSRLPLVGFVEPSSSFRYEIDPGLTVSVRLENRYGYNYWYMRKYTGGQSHNVYICKQGELTEGALQNAADALVDKITQAANADDDDIPF
jgi:hypothetical protein